MTRSTKFMRGVRATALATSLAIAPLSAYAENLKLGVLIYSVGLDPWLSVAADSFEKKGPELGFDVTVVDGRNDIGQMSAAIDQFRIQGMDGIIVQPPDADSLVGAVSKAVEAGIPVISYSFKIAPEAGAISSAGSDEVSMGMQQAQIVADALGGKGNVALMTGILGTSAQLGRSEGQHEVFAKYPDIKIVEEQANDWAPDKTVALIQDWLSKYPEGELNAVIAHGPELVAAADYAKSRGREEIIFVALDYPQDARRAIEEGTLYATISQSPTAIAILAMENMKVAIEGGAIKPELLIETPAITAQNVAQYPADY